MRCLETSVELNIPRTRHDGLQGAEVTQGGGRSVANAPLAMGITTRHAMTWRDLDEDGVLMEPYLGMISLYHLTGSHLPDNNKTQVTLSAKPEFEN